MPFSWWDTTQGIASTEYRQLAAQHSRAFTPYSATGNLSISVAAGRISYTFGLKGPAIPVETACSSSLVSLHTALNAISLGQCPLALNAGINMLLIPSTTAMFQKAGMLALDGRCKTLSEAADGYVRSDAAGVYLIAPPRLCHGDGQQTVVIVGTGVNQDGRSSSLTAPNGPAQSQVVRDVLISSGLHPNQVTALQMHGTGTSLGDPIEIGAASSALMNDKSREEGLVLMAAKSWTGHAEAGAGLVGMLHAKAAIGQASSLPLLHLVGINPYVHGAMGDSSWLATRQAAPLGSSFETITTGISAFAFQGTNAHTVIQRTLSSGYGASETLADQGSDPFPSQWMKQRAWVHPVPHPLLRCVLIQGWSRLQDDGAVYACKVNQESCAYLWDHQVAGRALFPGAGFMELAFAAVDLLGVASANNVGFVSLTAASIPAPLILPSEAAINAGSDPELKVSVNVVKGTLSIHTHGAVHLRGSFSAVPNIAEPLLHLETDEEGGRAKATFVRGILPQVYHASRVHATMGSVSKSTVEARDAYFSPAALDNCLQLGAVPASVNSSAAPSTLKVPAGVQCIVLPRVKPGDETLFAAGLEVEGNMNSSSFDFGIHMASTSKPMNGIPCRVSNLLAKVLGPMVPATNEYGVQTQGANHEFVHPESLYQSEWVGTQPWLRSALASTTIGDPVASNVAYSTSMSSSDAAVDCSQAIGLMQELSALESNLTVHTKSASAVSVPACGKLMVANERAASHGWIWGLLRTLPQELQSLQSNAVDLDVHGEGVDRCMELSIASAKTVDSNFDVYGTAVRSNLVLKASLRPLLLSSSQKGEKTFDHLPLYGRVVILGGLGSIGSLTASWLGKNSKSLSQGGHVVLVGRNGRAIGDSELITDLVLSKTPVEMVMSDSATQEGASVLCDQTKQSFVYGVIHSGGVLADGLLVNQAPSTVRKAFAPKSTTIQALQNSFIKHPLAFEILYSSVASLLGSPGQSNYAAANSFLDYFAATVQSSGICGTTVQWGAWAGAGMASHDSSTAKRVERLGMGMLEARWGLNALDKVLTTPRWTTPLVACVPFNWNKFIARFGSSGTPFMFKTYEIVQHDRYKVLHDVKSPAILATAVLLQRAGKSRSKSLASGQRRVGIGGTPRANVGDQISQEVKAVARSILGRDVGETEPLMSAGMDSLSSVEFRNSLGSKVGMELPSTLVFDYPSITSIVGFVSSELGVEASQDDGNEAAGPSNLQALEREIGSVAQGILGSPVEVTAPLMTAGLDSLSAVEFRNSLSSKLGIELPSTLVFDFPTVKAISQFVADQAGPIEKPSHESVPDGRQLVTDEVREVVKTVLRIDMEDSQDFIVDVNVNEQMAARFVRALSARLGLLIPPDLLKMCKTPAAVVDFLCTEPLIPAVPSSAQNTTANLSMDAVLVSRPGKVLDSDHAAPYETVFVAGAAGRLPGDIFRDGETCSVDGCRSISADRWDTELAGWLTGGMAVRFAGLLSNVSDFDSTGFGISDSEAVLMDPQQRLVLESVAQVLLHQGYGQARTNVGVFVGCSSEDYAKLSTMATGVTAYTGTGTSSSVLSGRVSFTFGLQGPALTIDTACSSSLSGIHMAYNALVLGQCEAALGSGVNLLLHPETLAILQKAGMLTMDGRCKTLSSTADGYVRAEAVGTFLLQTGETRVSECLAILAGSAVNQDGRSSSLTAPNGPAQQSVVRAALQTSQLEGWQVSALQMHGTGTALGDPIEIGAAHASLVQDEGRVNGNRDRTQPLVLLASKSWMGHAEPGAGVAGLIHAQVSLSRALQLPILHLGEVNEYVGATMRKNPTCWAVPRQSALMTTSAVVGTSAFAFQGTNAHVLLRSLDGIAANALLMPVDLVDHLTMVSRRRCWLSPPPHSLLSSVRWMPRAQQVLFSTPLSHANLSYLWDHRVAEKIIFPGAGYFEAALSAARITSSPNLISAGVPSLVAASIPAPLLLPQEHKMSQIELLVAYNATAAKVEVASSTSAQRPVVHLSCGIEYVINVPASIPVGQSRSMLPDGMVSTFTRQWKVNSQVASVAVVTRPLHDASTCCISPTVIDNMLQLGAARNTTSELLVPAGVGNFSIPGSQDNSCHACTFAISEEDANHVDDVSTSTNYGLRQNASGLMFVKSLQAKPLGGSRPLQSTLSSALKKKAVSTADKDILYETEWVSFMHLFEEENLQIGSNGSFTLGDGRDNRLSTAMAIAQCLPNVQLNGALSFDLITSLGSVVSKKGLTPSHGINVQDAGLWGLARTVAQEFPNINVSGLGVSTLDSNTVGNPTISALGQGLVDRLAQIGSGAYGTSMEAGIVSLACLKASMKRPAMPPFRLFPSPRGALQNLKPELLSSEKLTPGTMRVAVKAVGINFRDVLNVLGMYPGDPGPPGGDCAGVIVAVGSKTNELQPGT